MAALGTTVAHADIAATNTPIPYPAEGVVLKNGALASISCSSTETCVAVGNFRYDTDTLFYPIVVRTNGTAVTSTKVSNASGLGDTTGYSYSSGLKDVDCLTDGSEICWAIGGSNRDSSGAYGTQSFLTKITSSTWEPTYVTHTTGLSNSVLTSISCWTATSCGVGGSISFNSLSRAAAGISSGENLSPSVLPLPGGVAATSKLLDISCVANGECLAIGRFYSGTEVKYFLSSFDGASWATQLLQLPSDVLPMDVIYESDYEAKVSCTETRGCLIVGQYRGQYGFMYAFFGVTAGVSNTVSTQRLSEGDTRSMSSSSIYITQDLKCLGGGSLNCFFTGIWGGHRFSSSYFMKKFDGVQFTNVVVTATSFSPEFKSFDCLSLTVCRGLRSSSEAMYIDRFSQLDLAAPVQQPVSPPPVQNPPSQPVLQPASPSLAQNSPVELSPTPLPASPSTTIAPTATTTTLIGSGLPSSTSSAVGELKVNKSVSHKSLAKSLNLSVTNGGKISITIASKYLKFCKVVGANIRALKAGTCKITIKIMPKKGRTVSKVATLKVSK